jgi:hypothetical protein
MRAKIIQEIDAFVTLVGANSLPRIRYQIDRPLSPYKVVAVEVGHGLSTVANWRISTTVPTRPCPPARAVPSMGRPLGEEPFMRHLKTFIGRSLARHMRGMKRRDV